MIEHEHTAACDKTTGREEIRLRRAVEAADRDRKAREHAQARRDAQTPAERAADDAERQRLRETMTFTAEGFNRAIAEDRGETPE